MVHLNIDLFLRSDFALHLSVQQFKFTKQATKWTVDLIISQLLFNEVDNALLNIAFVIVP